MSNATKWFGRRTILPLIGAPVVFMLAGCHSAFVQATVVNETGAAIQIFEVDYPSASFGAGGLANGGEFHYRFKVIGTGQAKVVWTDATSHDHSEVGPELHEGEEGRLVVTLRPNGVAWSSEVHPSR